MADYTVLIMLVTSTHVMPEGKEGSRHREFESVDVFPWHGQPNGHPRQSHIHLMNCPLSIQRLKRFLLHPHLSTVSTDGAEIYVARRRYIWGNLPARELSEFKDEGHTTVQYADMFDYMLVRNVNTRTTGLQPSIADL